MPDSARYRRRRNELTRAVSRLTYVDDELPLRQWAAWLGQDRPPAADVSNPLMLMMFSVLGFVKRSVSEMPQAFDELWSTTDLRNEIVQLLRLLDDRTQEADIRICRPPVPPPRKLQPRRNQRRASPDTSQEGEGNRQARPSKAPPHTGWRLSMRGNARADILYVELDKDPKHYTRRRSTMIRDHAVTVPLGVAIAPRARTRGTGRRYRASADSDWRILLFVRHKPDDGRGFTSPYLFLGRVRYVSHESEKPMRITWKLDAEMPLDFFSEVKIAAG